MARLATRLFVAADLADGLTVDLAAAQAHQLRSVLRLAVGAELALFNGRHGEWRGRIDGIGKGWCAVAAVEQLRPQPDSRELALLFAPIKRARIDFLVEKATELGVSALHPVWTERTSVERINRERLQAHAIEAAEQSERLAVPEVHEPVKLSAVIAAWPQGRRLVLCDESGRAPPIVEALLGCPPAPGGTALLVGPEGGFTESELDALTKLPFVTPVGLGPLVLRADTAALAVLAVFQAVAGDWRDSPRAAPAKRLPPRP